MQLEGLEVSNGWAICAGDESLAVSLEPLLDDREYFRPVVCNEGIALGLFGCTTGQDGVHEVIVSTTIVLDEVDHGVDGPACHGIIRVVTKTNAEHAQNGRRLAHCEAVFLPDGHAA